MLSVRSGRPRGSPTPWGPSMPLVLSKSTGNFLSRLIKLLARPSPGKCCTFFYFVFSDTFYSIGKYYFSHYILKKNVSEGLILLSSLGPCVVGSATPNLPSSKVLRMLVPIHCTLRMYYTILVQHLLSVK